MTMTATTVNRSVYVVDDDDTVREAVTLLLRLEGYDVQAFSSGDTLLVALDDLPPGCVVLDIKMPGMDGPLVQAELGRLRPDLTVIMITGDGDVPLAVRAMKAGAADFLEKPFRPENLLRSVELAMASLHATPPEVCKTGQLATLTAREREVLDHLIEGETSKEIARAFGGSPRTVEIHRARIMEKLGARNVAEAVRIALRAG